MRRGATRSSAIWSFLAGLGSMTEVHRLGSIAITELVMLAVAPVLFFKSFHQLRYAGFMSFVSLTILTCVGACFSRSQRKMRLSKL